MPNCKSIATGCSPSSNPNRFSTTKWGDFRLDGNARIRSSKRRYGLAQTALNLILAVAIVQPPLVSIHHNSNEKFNAQEGKCLKIHYLYRKTSAILKGNFLITYRRTSDSALKKSRPLELRELDPGSTIASSRLCTQVIHRHSVLRSQIQMSPTPF